MRKIPVTCHVFFDFAPFLFPSRVTAPHTRKKNMPTHLDFAIKK